MSEKKVVKNQVYLANEDKRRWGSDRTLTVLRKPARMKKEGDEKPRSYVHVMSCIQAVSGEYARTDLVGKRRRILIRTERLLSSEYALLPDGYKPPAAALPPGVERTEMPNHPDRPAQQAAAAEQAPVAVPCGAEDSCA